MATLDAGETAFVQEVFTTWSAAWQADAKTRLTGRGIRVDDVLLESVATKVLPGEIQIMFSDHGRFHDMGAGRGYHMGKFVGSEERAEYLKGRTPSKWYSRFTWGRVYGSGGLVDMLSNAYIREAPKEMVAAFNRA